MTMCNQRLILVVFVMLCGLSTSFALAGEGDFNCRLEIRRGTSYGDPVIRQPNSETESAEMQLKIDGDYITIVSRSDEHYAGTVVFGKPDEETNYQPTIQLSIGPLMSGHIC